MTKAEIRAKIAEQKRALGFQTLEKMSAAVIEKFQTLEIFQTAKAVGAYMPMADEVDITPLFQTLEKVFYIPAFDKPLGAYRMARLTPELKKGRFGIPEPADPVFAAEDELDLIIVPGVAFDRAGGRVGRGGGFYDRLLPQYRAVRAGICFDFQCLPAACECKRATRETVPSEEHDIRLDCLVTEKEILKFATNS